MTKHEDELPPFSLKEAEAWLSKLEDIATITRDSEYANRMMLIHLFKHLHGSGTVDGERFVEELTVGLYLVGQDNYRLALSVLIDELKDALKTTNTDPR